MTTKTKLIEAYSVVEYSTKLQQAIQEGYVLDIENNNHCPVQYGGYFSATLVEQNQVEQQVDSVGKSVTEQVPTKTRGRPAK